MAQPGCATAFLCVSGWGVEGRALGAPRVPPAGLPESAAGRLFLWGVVPAATGAFRLAGKCTKKPDSKLTSQIGHSMKSTYLILVVMSVVFYVLMLLRCQ